MGCRAVIILILLSFAEIGFTKDRNYCLDRIISILNKSHLAFGSSKNGFNELATYVYNAKPDLYNFRKITLDLMTLRWNVAKYELEKNARYWTFDFANPAIDGISRIDSFSSDRFAVEVLKPTGRKYIVGRKRLEAPIGTLAKKGDVRYEMLFQKLVSTHQQLKEIEVGLGTEWLQDIFLVKDSDGRYKRVSRSDVWSGKITNAKNHLLFTISIDEKSAFIMQGFVHNLKELESYLFQLWEDILLTTSQEEAARLIKEFEYIFIGANLPGRGGASIGDALGTILRIEKGIPLRDGFQHVDFEIFSALNIDDYISK